MVGAPSLSTVNVSSASLVGAGAAAGSGAGSAAATGIDTATGAAAGATASGFWLTRKRDKPRPSEAVAKGYTAERDSSSRPDNSSTYKAELFRFVPFATASS